MNRKIKFKGKSNADIGEKIIQKGDWVYGGIAFDSKRVWIDTPYIGQVIVDDNTIGQFTGLHDRAGIEIYESDIIKITRKKIIKNKVLQMKPITAIVEWSEEYLTYVLITTSVKDAFESLADYLNEYDIEVIGNVNENPELLGGE